MTEPEDGNPPDDDDRDSDPMNPEAWYGEPNICGSCIAWRPRDPTPDDDVATGVCRLRAELRRVPASLKKCDLYKPRGKFTYQPGREKKTRKRKKAATTLRVLRRNDEGEMVSDRTVTTRIAPPRERPPVPRTVDVGTDDRSQLRRALRDAVIRDVPDGGRDIMARFEGGTVKVIAKDGKVAKEVSSERFFELLERFRGSLEQLEDQIVARDPLLSQYDELKKQILGIQGTLTTFNFLYDDRADYFSGKG